MTEAKYKWANAHEWLLEKIDEWTPEQIQECARNFALNLDADTVQDFYQSDMSEDGYFSPLCEECSEPIDPSETTSNYCWDHKETCSRHADRVAGSIAGFVSPPFPEGETE